MSIRFFRLLVAVVFALLLPLQGLAAVSAGICMSLGHHEATATGEHRHGGEGHKHPGAGHAHAGEHGDHDHALPAEGGEPGAAHCGPCVACCAAASIAPGAKLFALEHAPYAAIAAPPFPVPGSLPEQLDRPPLAL